MEEVVNTKRCIQIQGDENSKSKKQIQRYKRCTIDVKKKTRYLKKKWQ
jgi:hypothetical protein